jgi:Mg-chelatase subunit ChlD
VVGALNRSVRNRRPRHREIDWNRTIRANLKHYQPEYGTVVPATRIGHGRKRSSLKDVILCIDQSGSMATSVVYAGIFGAVLASLPALSTQVVVFDTSVVDLTEKLSDPVEVLFGTQLGGGTDIGRALGYCQSLIRRPSDTVFILISDLIEGGVRETLIKRAASIIGSGVTLITLLALSDDGAPVFDPTNAADLAGLGSPAFACTPDLFPELIAAAIQKQDISQWAAGNDLTTARSAG